MRDDTGPCFFCPGLPGVGEKASLAEEETRHASAARRIRVGDNIGLIDGEGVRARAEVEAISRHKLTFTVRDRQRVEPPGLWLDVASAVPKGERYRTMIDMLSQIGVRSIVPLICERSTVRPRAASVERWRRLAIEACKQSRNPYVPHIHEPRFVMDALRRVPEDALLAFADARGDTVERVMPSAGHLHLYIGPEGGFTEEECQLLRDGGARPVKFGDNILRVETAGVVGAALSLLAAGRKN